ncbi:MAG: flagellar hook-associated protein FlgK, partial [Methylobacter sp.]
MSGLLSTSLSGLLASQRALETTQNNISNVNTDGYSRQRVEFATNPAQFTGDGYIGQGVNVSNVARSYDQFVNKQLSASTSAYGETNSYYQLATNVDNVLGDSSTSIAPAMDNFFNALSSLSSDPSSIPSRQVFLSDADALAQKFNSIGGRFEDLRKLNNTDISGKVNDINSIASSIADLNAQIAANLGKAQGLKQPNDLLDQQDALLSKLSEIINVSVVPQEDGSSSVFIGNGQALVLNNRATTFTTIQSQSDPGKLSVGIKTTTGTIDITSQISGGSLGGALRFRDEVLDPAQQKLGQLAAGLAMEVNAVHEKGFDLNGAAGTALFSFSGNGIPVMPNSKNIGNAAVTASFQDVNA